MIPGKKSALLYLLILMMPLFLVGSQEVGQTVYSLQQGVDDPVLERVGITERPLLNMATEDPVLGLLGKSFDEIKQLKGEPDEEGYSEWLGPHNYILFRKEEGSIRFCSPELLDVKIAVSILLGPGQEVLGAKVGMLFAEIKDILGEPDFGPEPGMDNLYYMIYDFGEITDGMPEAFISFSAVCIDCPTQEVLIKWEAFDYGQAESIAATGNVTAGSKDSDD